MRFLRVFPLPIWTERPICSIAFLRFITTLLFLSAAFVSGRSQTTIADLVLRNGKIVTVDDKKPEAEALTARGDVVVAVGTNKEIQSYVGPKTKVIDLKGRLAIPGFIDAHAHFMSIGQAKMNLDLTKVKNWDEIVAMVAEAVKKAKPGGWILGRGWHQEKWDRRPTPNIEGFPTHVSLSKVSPNNPVMLTHASGHAGFTNAKAMELAGITKLTPNPAGGEILRDKNGNPTGLLLEIAQRLVSQALAKARAAMSEQERDAESRKQAMLAAEDCLKKGITTFEDAGSSFATIDLLKKMIDEGKMGVRLWVMVRASNGQLRDKLAGYKIINYGNKHLTVRAIKCYMDGALGSRGAWLLEPYSDLPTSTGLNTTPLDELKEAAEIAIQNGFQFCVHAIGDRANRETLNIYESAFKAHPDKTGLRWRIEHAQHLSAADIPRFGQFGVIAAMQGIHCTSDGAFVIARLGAKRAEEGAYVWQKLMKSGAIVANGTDAPVEDVDPIPCFHASVTRKLKDGSLFYADQRLSRQEALESYTLNGAYAAFEENIKGSLTPGKLADITVLSKDIMTIPDDEIPTAKVVYTIVGGKVMYEGK
jgi:predicted amidohydrolase YtcJ